MPVLRATSILAGILITSSIAAKAGPIGDSSAARRPGNRSHSTASEGFHSAFCSEPSRAEQKRLSRFDAKRSKLDGALDSDLSICRC
jgi:hypothetical protein